MFQMLWFFHVYLLTYKYFFSFLFILLTNLNMNENYWIEMYYVLYIIWKLIYHYIVWIIWMHQMTMGKMLFKQI